MTKRTGKRKGATLSVPTVDDHMDGLDVAEQLGHACVQVKKRRGNAKDGTATVAVFVVAATEAAAEVDHAGPARRTRSRSTGPCAPEQPAAKPHTVAEPAPASKTTAKRSKPAQDTHAQRKEGSAKGSRPAVTVTSGSKAVGATGATRAMEDALWKQGYTSVVGIDEAGRGPLAGPVVAAACCLPPGVDIPGVADSKQLDEAQREALYEVITSTPGVVWATACMDHTTIDRVNILQAAMMAMSEAARKLPAGRCDYLLVDGNRLPKDLPAPAKAVVQGDKHVFCIAAASILAKVTRDRLMLQYHTEYPQYNFAKHKGYAVPAHYEALHAHGISAIHRKSFQPIRGMTGWTREAQLKTEAEEAQAAQQLTTNLTDEAVPVS